MAPGPGNAYLAVAKELECTGGVGNALSDGDQRLATIGGAANNCAKPGSPVVLDEIVLSAARQSRTVAVSQRRERGGEQQPHPPGYPWPMIDAVATSSSNSAIDTAPDTAYGSSVAVSEYLISSAGFSRLRLTWPIDQPAKRRSPISS